MRVRKNDQVLCRIEQYPRMWAEVEALEHGIIWRHRVWTEGISASEKARPTELKAEAIQRDKRILHLLKLTAPVEGQLRKLSPQYRRVVCLRFWGVESAEAAIRRVKSGDKLRRTSYAMMDTVSGYCDRQAGRIVRAFIAAVAAEIEREGH